MTVATLPENTIMQMELSAKQVVKNAYCVHSNFAVGAVILGDNDKLYAGCNVESSAYGATICAECNAISSAIAAGVKTIKAVLVYTPTEHHTFPCGNCRQVLNEFSEDLLVYLSCATQPRYQTNLISLLPNGFGPYNLASVVDNKEQVA